MNKEKDYKITNYQTIIMRQKDSLNFNESLKENNEKKRKFDKIFRNHLDIFIKDLNNKGILFYGFTLNFREYIGDEKLAWKLIHFRVESFFTQSKNLIELLEFIYLSIECHGERQENREQLLLPIKINVNEKIEKDKKNYNKCM